MYYVNAVSLQNIYAPQAAEKYEQTGGSGITADNLYDILCREG